jgi:hypothetical protein
MIEEGRERRSGAVDAEGDAPAPEGLFSIDESDAARGDSDRAAGRQDRVRLSPRRAPPDRSTAQPARQTGSDPLGESGWKALFRPAGSARPGTMPAGIVLYVMVIALLLATFLSADAINRKAAGRRNNADWRKTTAAAVFAVSDALGIDQPARDLDDTVGPSIGHERKTENVSSDDVAADRQRRAAAAAAPPESPGTKPGPGASAPAAPAVVDQRPKLRAPTPGEPLKLWVGGDSISYEPAVAVSNIAARTKLFTFTQDSRPSTGLSRPDYFNWPQHLDRDIVPVDGGGLAPDVVMIMFGANDAQNIPKTASNPSLAIGTAEWQDEYRKRVGDTMDILKSPKNDRLVLWIGAPIMGPNSGVKHLDQLDYIFWSEAQKRPWIQYFDTWPYFADDTGAYTKSLPSGDGTSRPMRANDNIHFSAVGGQRLALALYAKLAKSVDLSAVPLAADPTAASPPEVQERPAVPPGEGQAP